MHEKLTGRQVPYSARTVDFGTVICLSYPIARHLPEVRKRTTNPSPGLLFAGQQGVVGAAQHERPLLHLPQAPPQVVAALTQKSDAVSERGGQQDVL